MQIDSLFEVLQHQVAEKPEEAAVVCDDVRHDWSAIWRRTIALANGLSEFGVAKGDRVVLLDRNSLEYFEFVFACAYLNAAAVVLNWRLTSAELSFIIGDAAPKVVIVRDDFYEVARDALERAEHDPGCLVLGEAPEGVREYATWIDQQPSQATVVPADPQAVVLQMYTSGTTGRPKGALITNANFAALVRASREWRMDGRSVNLAAMPLFHIGGGGWALAGMAHGARTVLVRDVEPRRLLATMEREGVTHAFLVPAVIQQMLDVPAVNDVSALRFLAYGASPISEAVLRRSIERFGSCLCQLYGMTETTGAVVQLDPEEHSLIEPEARLLRSAGKPMPEAEIRIVDPASTDLDVPAGSVGEVWIRSASVMKGYWRNPEATARAIDPDGWFRSGDLGYLEDGYLYLRGRLSHMIISGGENIYPAEVENALMEHPLVAEVAVVGVPSARWGESPKAFVVLRAGADLSAQELERFCRTLLAGYKIPREFVFMDVLPRSGSGKVERSHLVTDDVAEAR